MIDDDVIRSRSNPAVKRARAARSGKAAEVVHLEGVRLVLDALAHGLALELVLVDESTSPPEHLRGHPQLRRASAAVMEAASGLRTPPGLIAVAAAPELRTLDTLEVDERTLLMVVHGIADPGNLGACARVAEAAGAAGLAFSGTSASPFGSKALRGSMGSLLRLPLYSAPDARVLTERGLRQVRAATRGGVDFRRYDWSGPVALWLSGETGRWTVEGDFDAVTIPMAGAVESLNVTAAATLLAFAAARI